MSPSTNSLHGSLRLTAAALALVLAGCGNNPPAYESQTQSAPVGSSGSTSIEPAQSTYSEPEPYEPVVELVGEPAPLAEGAPDTYVVQVGDTLWDIAGTYYRNPWLYPKIARANNIADPDIIFADQTIIIPQD